MLFQYADYFDRSKVIADDARGLKPDAKTLISNFEALGLSEAEARDLAASGYLAVDDMVLDTFHGGAIGWPDSRTRFEARHFLGQLSTGTNRVSTYRANSPADVARIVAGIKSTRQLLFRGQTSAYALNRKVSNPNIAVAGYGEPSLLPSVWRRVLGTRRDISHTFHNLHGLTWQSIIYDLVNLREMATRALKSNVLTMSDHIESDDPDISRFGRMRQALMLGDRNEIDVTLGTLLQHYGLYSPVLDVTSELEIALFFATHKFHQRPDGCHYEFVGTNTRKSVIYVLRDQETDTYSRALFLEDLDPKRPQRQACVVVPTDHYSMNLPGDLITAIIALDFDLSAPVGVTAKSIFPGPDEDLFLAALLNHLRGAVRDSVTVFH